MRLAGLLLLAMGAGCASSPRKVAPAFDPAEIVVENHTDLAWRVSFHPALASDAPKGVSGLAIPPRETRRVTLAGGSYVVSRELASPSGEAGALSLSPGTADEVTLRFEPGRIYTWPMGTLFSMEGSAQ